MNHYLMIFLIQSLLLKSYLEYVFIVLNSLEFLNSLGKI